MEPPGEDEVNVMGEVKSPPPKKKHPPTHTHLSDSCRGVCDVIYVATVTIARFHIYCTKRNERRLNLD